MSFEYSDECSSIMDIDVVSIRKIDLNINIFSYRNFAYDNQIRNDLVELYQTMFNINRPQCLPLIDVRKLFSKKRRK